MALVSPPWKDCSPAPVEVVSQTLNRKTHTEIFTKQSSNNFIKIDLATTKPNGKMQLANEGI